jgi:hypothetical protein
MGNATMEQEKNSEYESAVLDRRSLIRMAGAAAALVASGRVAIGDDKKSAAPAVVPLLTEFVYEALVEIQPAVEVGPSSHGTRRYIPITGGTFAGPRIKGIVLPGGADWQLERPDGAVQVDALYSIQTDDKAVIIVHNRGLIVGTSPIRTVLEFEAPKGQYDWLNKAIFVGSLTGASRPGTVVIRAFRVL